MDLTRRFLGGLDGRFDQLDGLTKLKSALSKRWGCRLFFVLVGFGDGSIFSSKLALLSNSRAVEVKKQRDGHEDNGDAAQKGFGPVDT
jgi:hypothetical protein